MVDQKEEVKMEKFIETMPTMIQTHLIICKTWAETKDMAKSLEHIIQKCDPPTVALPPITTGATVLGLYSHIAHSVDKDETEIQPPFKGMKPKQTRGRGKPKENLQCQGKILQKNKTQKRHTHMTTLIIIIIMIVTHLLANIEAVDHFLVKTMIEHLEDLIQEVEVRNLKIVNNHLTIRDFRDVHIKALKTNMAIDADNSLIIISKPQAEEELMGVLLVKEEDVPVVDLITTLPIIISINITCTSNRQSNMAHPAVYAADLIIPPSTAIKVNMT